MQERLSLPSSPLPSSELREPLSTLYPIHRFSLSIRTRVSQKNGRLRRSGLGSRSLVSNPAPRGPGGAVNFR